MRYILFFLCVVFGLQAKDGDTTVISAHQQTDLTWYRSYRDWAVFPDSNSPWQEITLRYTMGCASGGCSDWDYTTLVNLMIPTGALDSNVASIDTISQNPLQIDTTWNVFPVKERFELCKVITPYGGALANNWTRTFYFDVSDYYPLLRDSVEIEVFYQGWSSGFSATLDFIMIEGAPIREVLDIENLYRGGFTYRNPQQFESVHMPARKLNLHPQAQSYELAMAPSGHGFVNALNCAEFCIKDYYVKVDGQQVAQQTMWRDDCGVNDLWPQAGTWLYDRANWCPGDRVNIYRHPLNLSGADSIDIDVEAYNYTIPPGETPANYNMSAQLLQFGSFNRQLDAALHDIISPSSEDEHARFNPVCNHASVEIRNEGAQDITNLEIRYGLKGNQNWQSYAWTGKLSPLETVVIEMPMSQVSDWQSYLPNMEFVAQIERVNGQASDEFEANNRRVSRVNLAEQLPSQLRFDLRTNNAANETFWRLEDASGNVLYSGDNLSNNTSYRDTFNLSPGCYMFLLGDREEDGLAFFANNDGSGRATLRNIGGNFYSNIINPNFGTEYKLFFTVGYGIGYDERPARAEIHLFPNPAQNQVEVYWDRQANNGGMLRLLDLQGRVYRETELDLFKGEHQMDLSGLKAGIYLVELSSANFSVTKRLLINP